jgi:ABC-2 type transport system ATP-binding protein
MKIKTSNRENLVQYLEEQMLRFKQDDGQTIVYATDVRKVMGIILAFKNTIEDIEVTKGTLNDVFIAITGKEIRV